MKQKPLNKSLLAMMVGVISTQALAVEVDIGQGGKWGQTTVYCRFNESVPLLSLSVSTSSSRAEQ